MTKGEKEMATLVGEWSDKISKITTNYERAIEKLTKIKNDYEKKWWQILLNFLPYIVPFVVLIILFVMLIFLPCNASIKYQGVEIARNCSPNK